MYPNIVDIINELHAKKVYFGLNLKPSKGLLPGDRCYKEVKELLNLQKDGLIPINIYNTNILNIFIKEIINYFQSLGIDYFWLDDINKDKIFVIENAIFILIPNIKNILA